MLADPLERVTSVRLLHVVPHVGLYGTGRVIQRLCGGLRDQGVSCRVLTLLPENPLAPQMRADGVPVDEVSWLPIPASPMLRTRRLAYVASEYNLLWQAQVVRFVMGRLAGDQISVVHGHDLHGALIGSAVARLLGRPLVVTDHGGPWRQYKELRNRIRFYRYGKLLARAATVVTVSESARSELVGHYPSLGSTTDVIPNPVLVPGSFRREPHPQPTVITVGRVTELKNQGGLIRAMVQVQRSMPEARLVIAGDGAGTQRFRSLTDTLRAGSFISFLGPVADPWPVLAAGWVYASLSRTESFGLAVAEAMAAGLPLVLSDIPAHRELTGDSGAAVFVAPDDPASAADALARLLADPGLRSVMGQQALARAQAYGLDECTRRHMGVYTRLAPASQ